VAAVLLETKLFLPKAPRGLVRRTRLNRLLDRATESKLLLVSAPAGFGKTTLLADWLASEREEWAAAWLSLDRGDNDPTSFWTYVIAALQAVEPGLGASERMLLQAPQPPPVEAVLTTLLNAVSTTAGEVVLVLDDYHLIDSREVHDGIAFLLEHLPPQLHVAIATRADPAVPLARLRARGELVEIRAAELRFTPEEAAAYLNERMSLQLTAQDVATLEGRTEGWIAALQLAALSMQGRDDAAGFIASFAGDDRFVIDYLVEEVLQRQTQDVQVFLMQTSVLDQLSGPLCDAVTGQAGGKAMLGALDRGNLFLVPLDDSRRWYRYHHLFADVLRMRLLDEQPDVVRLLHQRASRWYEQHGRRAEAIRHAMAGEDFERAADLIELAMPAMFRSRQETTLRSWLDVLPDEIIDVRPVLSIGCVAALLSTGQLEGVESHLRIAEGWLEATTPTRKGPQASSADMVVTDQDAFRGLPSAIALYRAGQARMLGDVPGTMTHARQALELAGEDDHLRRGGASALLGLASWTVGDLDAGFRLYADAMADLQKAGHLADTLGCAIVMADIRITQGRLREAWSIYEQGLRRAGTHTGPVLAGTADMHVGMSELCVERNELDAARQHLRISKDLGEHAGLPQNPYRWCVAMAAVHQTEGDFESALGLLDEAERRYTSDFSPEVRTVAAVRARAWVAGGRPDAAIHRARARGLSTTDDLDYLREFEHITMARALLASCRDARPENDVKGVIGLLERLLQAAEDGRREGSVIEILVLLALARRLRGDTVAALTALERALTAAEREGYVRMFIGEGPPIVALLEAAVDRGIVPGYARRLLAAAGERRRGAPRKQGLAEPLSARELDVLRLLATDLAGPAIAGELVVSLNTVRTHTQRIYAKLGVSNRRLAVRRARELDLL
jgi:LuxR family maltose regulon positive regulatory protein